MTMTQALTSRHSRRTKRDRDENHYGKRALLGAILFPVLLAPWAAGRFFTELCSATCSYSEFRPVAIVAQGLFLAASCICLVVLLRYAVESIAAGENKIRPIIATVFSGLFTAFFAFGAFDHIALQLANRFFGFL